MKNIVVVLIACSLFSTAYAQDGEDLAKQLANPLAALISVPMQLNYDEDLGPGDEGSTLIMNVQPVIPFSISDDWNLISRTILPIIDQQDLPSPGDSKFGLGDTVQSLFFSPKAVTSSGWILGAGPVFLLPTATDKVLSGEKWGAGPTAVALKQSGQWTYGGLMNHIESFAGDSDRADVSATFLNPFISFITKSKTTFGLSIDSTYDWESKGWSVPINVTVSQLMKIGKRPLQIGGGVRYWADTTDTDPQGWGLRLQVTLLFPK